MSAEIDDLTGQKTSVPRSRLDLWGHWEGQGWTL